MQQEDYQLRIFIETQPQNVQPVGVSLVVGPDRAGQL